MNIYILTRGRLNAQHTWNNLDPILREHTWLVCPHGEESEVLKAEHNIWPVPPEIDNYNKKFQWVIDNTEPDEKFVIMDDDLHFSRRIPGTQKLEKLKSVEETVTMITQLSELMDGYALGSIHPRQMGHTQELPCVYNTKILRVQAINKAKFPPDVDRVDNLPILADIMLACNLLQLGYPNIVLTSYTQDHKGGQSPGGCSLYRTAEMQAACAHWVAARYGPDHVKVEIKRPKTATWLGKERVDLRMQWKRMYKEAALLSYEDRLKKQKVQMAFAGEYKGPTP